MCRSFYEYINELIYLYFTIDFPSTLLAEKKDIKYDSTYET